MNLDKLNRSQLIEKLERAIENREIFYMMHDDNMVRAWEEQCEIILEKIYGVKK